MPVVAPLDDLLEKRKSNLQHVKARGGQMMVFEDEQSNISSESVFKVIKVTTNSRPNYSADNLQHHITIT